MGADMAHHESRFFTLEINDRMVMGGGAAWSRYPIMSETELTAKLDAVRRKIHRSAFKAYLRAGYDGVSAWGFKDPRACVTLPILLEVFPRARVLQIVRNEDDVVDSLANTKKTGLGLLPDREHWRALRNQHLARARAYGLHHGDYYEFAYEDFCLRPLDVTRAVFDRLGLPWTSDVEAFLTTRIHADRVGAVARAAQLAAAAVGNVL